MQTFFNKLPFFAPIVLRLGLAGVFVWFGTSQILDQSMWTSFIPTWAADLTGLSNIKLVLANGCFEVVMAVLLVFGFWVRPVAALLFLHMCSIVATVGLDSIGVRDVAIATGLLSVTLSGNDIISWHYKVPTPPASLISKD